MLIKELISDDIETDWLKAVSTAIFKVKPHRNTTKVVYNKIINSNCCYII